MPGQEEIIDKIIGGMSCLGVFPTGQGKSLCYQLSSLHLPGLTLVVSPLVALMKDQVDFLVGKSISAARLDSSLSQEEFSQVQKSLIKNEIKLLYVAPERFANERFLNSLKLVKISLMVVDEVHCISEWGHNFRPDYLKLTTIKNDLNISQVLGLTATATPKVAEDIMSAFKIPADNFILTGFYRPNLTLLFSPSPDPMQTLLNRLQARPKAPAIVYVTLQATAEKVAEALINAGFTAQAYHAGLKDETRHEVQDWFMSDDTAIVVATIAFGMGIDKADIRHVYHYNLAKSLENYTQEIGRAGRDGQKSICETLGGLQDLTILENFVYGDTPEASGLKQVLTDINNEDDIFSLSIYHMSHTYDIRNLVITTLLTYLELENIISSTGPFYTEYKFIPQRPSAEIFAPFSQERVDFLKKIFSCAKKGKKWFSLNIDEAIEKSGSDRKRVVTALNYLEEQGDLSIQVSGARRGYRLLCRLSADELEELCIKITERFIKREANDILRISQVVSLINHDGCQTNYLLDYFGEHRKNACGHCEACLKDETKKDIQKTLGERPAVFEFGKWTGLVMEVLNEKNDALKSPRQQARFFCGISSPQTSRAGLLRHKSYGLLANLPFNHVLKWLEEFTDRP